MLRFPDKRQYAGFIGPSVPELISSGSGFVDVDNRSEIASFGNKTPQT